MASVLSAVLSRQRTDSSLWPCHGVEHARECVAPEGFLSYIWYTVQYVYRYILWVVTSGQRRGREEKQEASDTTLL
jgi:hypothetical protein